MFLKRKKLQKHYIVPATTKIKSKSRAVGHKVKEQYTRISTKLSNFSIPKSKIKMKRQRREKVKPALFRSNKPKIQAMKKIKPISSKQRTSVKLTSINSFLED